MDEAATLYQKAFGTTASTAFNGMVLLLDVAGHTIMLLNGGPQFAPNASISFFVSFNQEAEIDTAWAALADGGSVFMPLNQYPWSNKYGWVQDRFGVSWQLILTKPGILEEKIVPALMFTKDVAGRAEEAMQFYTTVFPNSAIVDINRYLPGEGDKEGTVKHGRFLLNGKMFVAFDSSMMHAFTFTEGVSIVVNCDTQEEIDHYWNSLTADGGQESRCGWLKDKYGVSWQIVPADIGKWMTEPGKGQRAMQALLQMRKIDIATLLNV
jgi:predicted 3-demethylubiquinone-9 3-methyltransferase (glyoxalase superfamily)